MIKNTIYYSGWVPPEPLVTCLTLNWIGFYCIILFIISFISNLALIWIYAINRKYLIHGPNVLLFALTVLSFIGTLIELPLVAASAFNCK